jgi:hypothetical protein
MMLSVRAPILQSRIAPLASEFLVFPEQAVLERIARHPGIGIGNSVAIKCYR